MRPSQTTVSSDEEELLGIVERLADRIKKDIEQGEFNCYRYEKALKRASALLDSIRKEKQ